MNASLRCSLVRRSAPRAHADPVTLCLFPGWGFDARVFQPVAWPMSTLTVDGWQPGRSEDELRAFLDARGLERIWLFGWSLGASRALAWARRFPERTGGLLLAGLRPAYPPEELDEQRRQLEADPQAAMRHFYRRALAGVRGRGAAAREFALSLEASLLESLDPACLRAGLDELQQSALQPGNLSYGSPARGPALVHGRRDLIAPAEEIESLAARQLARDAGPTVQLTVLPHAGHAVFLSDDFPAWLSEQCGTSA